MKNHVPLKTGKARPLGAENANLGRGAGRPLTDSAAATGHIHLRVTMERKNKYVRAARKRKLKLSEWMTETCDKSSGDGWKCQA
jgi:hypothetical protein